MAKEDLCTCTYQRQRADRAEQEVERLNCMLELTTNLKHQADREVEKLEQENEQLKKTLQQIDPYRDRDYRKSYTDHCQCCHFNINEGHKEDCDYKKLTD